MKIRALIFTILSLIAFVILLSLKLTGIGNINWFEVFLPFLIGLGVEIAIESILVIVALLYVEDDDECNK